MTPETYHEIVKHLAIARKHLEQAQELAQEDEKLCQKIAKTLKPIWPAATHAIEQEIKQAL